MPAFVGALDQGTTSSRFIVFDHDGVPVARHQLEHAQHYPRAGWVEHDPLEILERARAVMRGALARAELLVEDLAAVGITNQRETAVVWDRAHGPADPPGHRVAGHPDRWDVAELASSGGPDRYRARTGLPLATYFSGQRCAGSSSTSTGRARAEAGDLLFGTIDTWLLWNLTGGTRAAST